MTTDVTFFQLFTRFFVVLSYVESPLCNAPEQISTQTTLVTELLIEQSLLMTVPQVSPHPILGVCY